MKTKVKSSEFRPYTIEMTIESKEDELVLSCLNSWCKDMSEELKKRVDKWSQKLGLVDEAKVKQVLDNMTHICYKRDNNKEEEDA